MQPCRCDSIYALSLSSVGIRFARFRIDGVTFRQDSFVRTAMSLRWHHEADTAELMMVVLPAHEHRDPLARLLNGCEAIRRRQGSVLERAE